MAGRLQNGEAALTALSVLDYTHAPAVGLYFLGALTFDTCTLQTAKPDTQGVKKRRFALSLILVIVVSYVAQAILYLSRVLAERNWSASQHSVIHVLGSILVWGCVDLALLSTKAPLWHPYFGCFIIGFVFETTICVLSAVSLATQDRLGGILLTLDSLRVVISLGLLVDGYFLMMHPPPEEHTDEEGQSLLGKQANGSATTANENANYGTTPTDSDGEGEEDDDEDKEIKEQQRKRLEEQGGWFGYLKGFAIFLPCLWPKDDWKIQFCLFILAVDVVQNRFLNLLIPRQIGIITDNLITGSGVMPWKDVALWTFYSWLGSFAGFGMVRNFASALVENYSYKRICSLAFSHVMDLSMDFHSNKDSGEVLRSVDQANSLNDLIELVLFDVVPVLLDLIVAMWYITHLFNMYMAFIILVIGIVYIWLGITLTAWAQPTRRTYVEKSRIENKTVYESISNWQTVSYFNRAPYERHRYGKAVQTTINAQLSYLFRSYTGHGVQSLLMTFGFAGCSVLAISQISTGRKPVGNFVTLIMYWDTMMNPLYTMADSYRQISSTLIDAERLLQLLNTKPSVVEAGLPQDLAVNSYKVEFKDVDFSYDSRRGVLKKINFVAEPGKTIAFVGETGGGKSTILKLLFRFYDVTGGSITIDDQDVRSVTISSLREALGVVPQDPSLFNQSILENVRYARLDATNEEIQEACKAAAIHDKVMTFPDGYKSKVGERGVKLSGGELQRVAIARVLLKNPKIVMLDEATSAVDSSTEAQIQEAFKRLSAGRTTFVVAHRLSTIMEADLILVVDRGEIIERGTHSELLQQGGKYLELWTKQTVGKPSKANSMTGADKMEDALINDIPAETYSRELAESFAVNEEEGLTRRRP